MSAALRAAVRGVGLWRPSPGAETPPPSLPARLRRRASLLVNMVAEVAAQATAQAGESLATVPYVVGSAFGELATTLDMLADIDGDGGVSPTQFQSSVHNTAVAYLTIAHDNRLAATSIAAGEDTTAMVLLEALSLLATRGGRVLAIVADESLPAVLGANEPGAALAAALLLEAPGAAGGAPLAWLEDPRGAAADAARPAPTAVPIAPVVQLVEAIRAGRSGRIALGREAASAWSVALRPGGDT